MFIQTAVLNGFISPLGLQDEYVRVCFVYKYIFILKAK